MQVTIFRKACTFQRTADLLVSKKVHFEPQLSMTLNLIYFSFFQSREPFTTNFQVSPNIINNMKGGNGK